MTLDLFTGLGRGEHWPSLADRIDASGDCWEWTGNRDKRGYGRLGKSLTGTTLAHRVVYEALVGSIPDGLTLDHLCQNQPCVNPDHLEPVTQRENISRAVINGRPKQSHCKRGHSLDDPDNIYQWGDVRMCRECRRYHDRNGRRKES